ncbi:hypothetical protein [Sodalis glossinidius]|uniref:hypothetical protein n=1 Tax=Sodalis glossinidius TaxID=63612 RepID=UPI0011D0786A|nr:hypothetical protein [Sodalis glossinidius]
MSRKNGNIISIILIILYILIKKLWIQLQDKSFVPYVKNVPNYILNDPIYKGGVLKQSILTAPERDPNKPAAEEEYSWAAKMWEKPVRERFQNLVVALGTEFVWKN